MNFLHILASTAILLVNFGSAQGAEAQNFDFAAGVLANRAPDVFLDGSEIRKAQPILPAPRLKRKEDDAVEEMEIAHDGRSLQAGNGIRYGTLYTDAGYDREGGVEPVCWVNEAPPPGYNGTTRRGGGTIDRFSFRALPNRQFMLSACPEGVKLNANIVDRYIGDEEGILRTNITYQWNVRGTVDLTNFPNYPDENAGYQTYEKGHLAVLCILCDPLLCGLCTPFTHSQSTQRLAMMGIERPWAYEYGERHGGTHIHSREGAIRPVEENQTKIDIDLDLDFQVNEEGTFYGICSIQFITTNSSNLTNPAYSWDIANVVDENNESLLRFFEPLEILEVEDGVWIASLVIIGIACAIQLGLLVCTLKERESQIMRLCQGKFLAAFLAAGIVATASAFLWNPKSSTYCNLQLPLFLIPLQIMVSILTGLIWRVHAVISPILLPREEAMRQQRGLVDRLVNCVVFFGCTCCGLGEGLLPNISSFRRTDFRKTVTERDLLRLIVILTAPQVIIQILSLTLGYRHQTLHKNEDRTTGRYECEIKGDEPYEKCWWWLGIAVFTATVLALLVTAYRSRHLPSLLNSLRSILDALVSTVFVLVVYAFILAVTHDPEISPSLPYMVTVLMIVAITLNLTIRIVLPKLRLVWKGERIVVSSLMASIQKKNDGSSESREYSNSFQSSFGDSNTHSRNRNSGHSTGSSGHSETERVKVAENNRKNESSIEREPSLQNRFSESRFTDDENQDSQNSGRLHATADPLQQEPPQDDPTPVANVNFPPQPNRKVSRHGSDGIAGKSGKDIHKEEPTSEENGDTEREEHQSGKDIQKEEPPPEENGDKEREEHHRRNDMKGKFITWKDAGVRDSSERKKEKVRKRKSLVLRKGEQPPKKLMLEMIETADLLKRVNDRLLSGFEVSKEEWESARGTSEDLHNLFARVQFEWECGEEQT